MSMTRKRFLSAGVAAVAVLWLFGCRRGPASAASEDIKLLVPAASDLQGWQKDGETQVFRGEDLYVYIDGGADIYQEYGFIAVAVQDYKDAGGKSLSLEVFQMKDTAAAFGMYTFKTSAGGKAVDLGGKGQLEDYYLNFWKGSYVITVTGFDEDGATIQGLQIIAGAVDARIRSVGKEPSLPALLPEQGLNRQSIKYIKGQIGLNNVYSSFPRRAFSFEEGVKGDYGKNAKLLILTLQDAPTGESLLARMGGEFRADDRFRNYRAPRPSLLQVDDDKGRTISAAVFKKFLIIMIGPGGSPAEALIELAGNRIKSAGL
jgi:hypothetical protein